MWTRKGLGIIALTGLLSSACTETKSDESLAANRFQIVTQQGLSYQGLSFQGLSFQGLSLQGLSLQGLSLQGLSLQGLSLQGLSLQGLSLQGLSLQGLSLQGLSLQGVYLSSIALDGSLLKGLLSNGTVISGRDFIGLTFTVSGNNPTPRSYTFRIDNVTKDTTHGMNDVWLYHISVKEGTQGSFSSICMDPAGNDHDLIPIVGAYWDEATGNRIDKADALTLGCLGGVIGKCARIGYRPWATGTQCKDSKGKNCSPVPLKDHHQACTRMFRADYCGNGQGYTKDGTIIDVFDYLDPAIQLREEKWTFEARWLPTGAMCVSQERHPELGFTGKCKDSKGKERTLRPCNPYEEDKGLVVSTFNGTGATGIKGDGKN